MYRQEVTGGCPLKKLKYNPFSQNAREMTPVTLHEPNWRNLSNSERRQSDEL